MIYLVSSEKRRKSVHRNESIFIEGKRAAQRSTSGGVDVIRVCVCVCENLCKHVRFSQLQLTLWWKENLSKRIGKNWKARTLLENEHVTRHEEAEAKTKWIKTTKKGVLVYVWNVCVHYLVRCFPLNVRQPFRMWWLCGNKRLNGTHTLANTHTHTHFHRSIKSGCCVDDLYFHTCREERLRERITEHNLQWKVRINCSALLKRSTHAHTESYKSDERNCKDNFQEKKDI